MENPIMTIQNLHQGQMAKLADGINSKYEAFLVSAQEAIQSAIECGKLLNHAKALVEHGDWLDWLQANTKIGTRQAQKLMRLAEHADEILTNANSGAYFTINAALAAISTPKSNSAEPVPRLLQGAGVSKSGTLLGLGLNREAFLALQSDLAENHSRGDAGRILGAICTVNEIEITPSVAAHVVTRYAMHINKPELRKSAATEADVAVAWLRDFTRELEKPPPSAQTFGPHLVHNVDPEVPDKES